MNVGRSSAAQRASGFVIVGLALLAIVLVAVAASLNTRRAERETLEALSADVHRVQLSVAQAIDTARLQKGHAATLLNWLEVGDGGSSGMMMAALKSLRYRPTINARLDHYHQLLAEGRAGVLRDERLRATLRELDYALRAAAQANEAEFVAYRARLEELLPPGAWRWLWELPRENHKIDYRATLVDLYHQKFDRTMRAMTRATTAQEAMLSALQLRADSAMQLIQAAAAGND